MRLDDPNRIESLDEIAFHARAIFNRPSRADGAMSTEIDPICPLSRRAITSSATIVYKRGREPINSEWSANVRFGAHSGLKSGRPMAPLSSDESVFALHASADLPCLHSAPLGFAINCQI